MSKIRTESQLLDAIDSNYSWRIKELSNLNSMIPHTKNDKQTLLIRVGVMLLYAHWEGFLKETFDDWYEFIRVQGLKLSDFTPPIISIALKQKLSDFEHTKQIALQTNLLTTMLEILDKRANFSSQSPISTSNLNFDVLSEMLLLIGVDIQEFETKKIFIDEQLLTNRNKIAHGKHLLIKYEEYLSIYEEATILIKSIKDEIQNSVTLKKYLSN